MFAGNVIDAELNNTLIVFIPKTDHPKDFSQFWPISLCSILYKLVMKVIANKFRFIFPKIISQKKAGFITGQSRSNNIIIAQEVIHCIRSKRKGRNWMTLKLDLEKAYDRVSWDFIRASLKVVGIPEFLYSVIMKAITSLTMQVLWNGVPTQKFKLVRGIRQGCPLSPYLFMLCIDWLGRLIHAQISDGKWNLIRLSCKGPDLSHLFFVDDLVIFCKAEMEQAQHLSGMLSHFCDFSRHRVSMRKSNIYFSKGTDDARRLQISQVFGFQIVHNLGTYLEVSLLHDRVIKSTVRFAVDKVRRKLQN